jgi:hypothetical protein
MKLFFTLILSIYSSGSALASVKIQKPSKRKTASLEQGAEAFSQFLSCAGYASQIQTLRKCTYTHLDPQLTPSEKDKLSAWILLSLEISPPDLCPADEISVTLQQKYPKATFLCFETNTDGVRKVGIAVFNTVNRKKVISNIRY